LEEYGRTYTHPYPYHVAWVRGYAMPEEDDWTARGHRGVKKQAGIAQAELMYDFAIEIRWRWCDQIYDLCRRETVQ
jgi:hypothetical protein